MTRRPFETTLQLDGEPQWRSLEAVARLARESAELPSFHECEFMYMGAVSALGDRLRIHLYKHRDTRRYLNLDDAGHAYQYCGSPPDDLDDSSGGIYRLHRSIKDAIESADLWIFDREPTFIRSCPPEAWPVITHENLTSRESRRVLL